MFFQSIYQMITAGTDLNINIRKVDNNLSVAVMPRRNSLKEDTRQNMVPLVVNGTPAELDMGFLQTILQPIQKVQGLLVNAENFEKQAEKATSQAKSSKAPTIPAESGQRRKSVRYGRGIGAGNSPTTRQHERSATARYANKHIPGATDPYYES